MTTATEPLPFKPNDWVSNNADNIARVKKVYRDGGEVLLDLVMYDWKGKMLGRVSPSCGGPRTFEPCCAVEGWYRVAEPKFPLQCIFVPDGTGKSIARHWAGERLPAANWTPPARPSRVVARNPHDPDPIRQALEQIADGHNDARQLAKDTLGR